MSDIFISYSRKDSEQALQLAERLQREGMSVWIDQRGIEGAKTWSEEIVNAIEASKAFLLLLSGNSIESDNVARELSLAFESKRTVVPVAIEDVLLPARFKYQLTGIQRVAYTQHDAITQALIGCGVTRVPDKKKDHRKSLMILPFQDLSPTQDNGWFADGIVSELISKLTSVKSLRLIDRQTSMQTKKQADSIADLARILEVRYFIEGSIRKFGEQIKIDITLLDFETGDYLWQETHKGVFADIFDIQEAIADKVVSGLKLHLGNSEKLAITKKRTDHPEAYAFYLKAIQESRKLTRAGFDKSIALYEEVVRLDPQYAGAYGNLAFTLLEYYLTYKREPNLLLQAERALNEINRIEGESCEWCWITSRIALVKKDFGRSEQFARQAIELNKDFSPAYDTLGAALLAQGRTAEALEANRMLVKLSPLPIAYFNLLINLDTMGDAQKLKAAAQEALPIFERAMKLNAEDLDARVKYAIVLLFASRREDAKSWAVHLLLEPELDGSSLYNLGCLLCELGESQSAITSLRRSIEKGYKNKELFYSSLLEPLRNNPEFQSALALLEDKTSDANV